MYFDFTFKNYLFSFVIKSVVLHSETITKSRSLIFSVLRNFPVHEGIFKIFDSTEVFDQRGSILIHTNDKTHTLNSLTFLWWFICA